MLAKAKAERLEQERLAAEEAEAAKKAESERRERARIMAEESRRLEAEREARQAELDSLKAENERLARERLAAEEQRRVEIERLKAENEILAKERLAAQVARQEIEKLKAENERARLAAEEEARQELERIERDRVLLAEQRKREEADRVAKEKLAWDEHARHKAIREAEERAAAAALADEESSSPVNNRSATSRSSRRSGSRQTDKQSSRRVVSGSTPAAGGRYESGEAPPTDAIEQAATLANEESASTLNNRGRASPRGSSRQQKTDKSSRRVVSGSTPITQSRHQSKASPSETSPTEAIYFCEQARDLYKLKGDEVGVRKMEAAIKAIMIQQQGAAAVNGSSPDNNHGQTKKDPGSSDSTTKKKSREDRTEEKMKKALGSIPDEDMSRSVSVSRHNTSQTGSSNVMQRPPPSSVEKTKVQLPQQPKTNEQKSEELRRKKERLSNLFGGQPSSEDAQPGNAFADMLKKSRRSVLKSTSTLDDVEDDSITEQETANQAKSHDDGGSQLSSSLPANSNKPNVEKKQPEQNDDGPIKRSYKVDKMSVSEKRKLLFG